MNIEMLPTRLLVDRKVVVESLQRIGISDKKRKILYPSCYLYSVDGFDYLCHFKELFMLKNSKNSYNNISSEDICRRNSIAFCLKNWGLIDVSNDLIEQHERFVFVLPHSQKSEWKIIHKFQLTE